MGVNERQIALRTNNGVDDKYNTLKEFLDRRKVIGLPFDESAQVAVSSAQFVLIDNTMTVATKLAVGKSTVTQGGLMSAELAGAVGSGANTNITDDLGNVLNMVRIRDATTHDPVMDAATDREVFALVQSANGVADGANIGAPASENTQLSFVYVAADGTLTLATVNQTIEFVQNVVYLDRYVPTIALQGGKEAQDVQNVVEKTRAGFQVTTAYIALEDIDITDGSSGSGASSLDGDTLTTIPSDFNTNKLWQVRLNGVVQRKGTPGATIEVSYVDGTHIEFRDPLDVGDYFEIEQLHN
jgi:hypothetical protein